jgi:hypothetical protein
MNIKSTKPIDEIAEIISCVPYGNNMVMYASNDFISNEKPIINPACNKMELIVLILQVENTCAVS